MKTKTTTGTADATSAVPVYSFDVFDTLITRKTGTPKGVFVALCDRLRDMYSAVYPPDLIADFFELRIAAEHRARCEKTSRETTLDRIYERFHDVFLGRISREDVLRLRDMEIEAEIEFSVGIDENVERVHRLLDDGARVVLLSDMYLPSTVIRSLLEKTSPRIAALPLYLSCEEDASKWQGGLFDRVCERESISPDRLHHLGDQRLADYDVPRSKGIRAERYVRSALNGIEKRYLLEDRTTQQRAVAASRLYRIKNPRADSHEILGATLGGPLLYGFVEETLLKAKRSGIDRLYFLARDGQVVLKIAEIINAARGLELDLRYLHCSRQVCRFATIFRLDERELNGIVYGHGRNSIESIASRLRMASAEFADHLPDALRKKIKQPSRELRNKTLCEIKRFLLADDSFRTRVETAAAAYREIFVEYLRQEGFFEKERSATVDLGWGGSLQDALFRVLRVAKGDAQLTGYYFGLLTWSVNTCSANHKEGYAKPPRHLVNVLEIITSADHGTVYGYERDGEGRIRPLLRNGDHLIRWGVRAFQRGITGFARLYAELDSVLPTETVAPEFFLGPIFETLCFPDRETAEILGSVPFSGDQNDSHLSEAAPPFSLGRLIRYHVFSTSRQGHAMSVWLGGSVARSSPAVRLLNRILERLRGDAFRAVRFVRRVSIETIYKCRDAVRRFFQS